MFPQLTLKLISSEIETVGRSYKSQIRKRKHCVLQEAYIRDAREKNSEMTI